MDVNVINELKSGLSAAYINGSVAANLASFRRRILVFQYGVMYLNLCARY